MPSITIQFRLPDTYKGELEDYAVRGESYSQTARRLLLDMLDGIGSKSSLDSKTETTVQSIDENVPSELGDRLTNLEKQLENVAKQVCVGFTSRAEDGDRLKKIEQHLEWCKRQAIDHDKRLKELESETYWTKPN